MAGYAKLYDWIINDDNLSLVAKFILTLILRRLDQSANSNAYSDEFGVYCLYTTGEMAEKVGASHPTVIKAKKQLIDAGYIKMRDAGNGRAHRIYIGDAVPKETEKPKKKATQKQKTEPSAGENEVEQVITAWNEIASEAGLLEHADDARTEVQVAKLIDSHGVDIVIDTIKTVGSTPFLTGKAQNSSGWKADLQWLSVPRNFENVLRGKYQDKAQRDEDKRKKNEDELMIQLRIQDVKTEWNRFIKRLKLESTDSHEQLEDYVRRLGDDNQILQAIRKMESMDSEDVKDLFDGKPISIDTMLSESIYTRLAA